MGHSDVRQDDVRLVRGGKGNRFRAGGGGGDHLQVGGRVELALLLVAAVVTGVLASIVPAWRAARISPAQSWTR